MTSERDQLKQILLPEELELLDKLKKQVLDRREFATAVSEVLSDATRTALKRDNSLQKQLSVPIAKGFDQAIESNRDSIVNAFIPIIGSIIRKSITNSIRKLTTDINRAVELGISVKAIKWRVQSLRTGVPFAEIVFNNTIEYDITQLFLIDNETGLLIEYAGQEDALMTDKDALSAMLTAIQDFVKDSVAVGESGLSAAELDDNIMWIISGPKAYLAAMIKGSPGARLNERLTVFTEQIHADYRSVLTDQSLWTHDAALKADLERQLITKTIHDDDDENKKPGNLRLWMWLIIFLILFGTWYWWQNKNHQAQKNLHHKLNSTDGLVIYELQRTSNGYTATGLQDPIADVSSFTQVQFNTQSYYSIDDSIVEKRVREIINLPDIRISVINGKVKLQGQQSTPMSSLQLQRILNLPGVTSVDNQLTTTQDFTDFINRYPLPEGLSMTQEGEDDRIILNGEILQDTIRPWLEQLQLAGFEFTDDAVLYVPPAETLETLINQSFVNMEFTSRFSDSERQKLHQIFSAAVKLNRFHGNYTLIAESHSDCSGSILRSNEYNRSREQALLDFHQENYADGIALETKLHTCTELSPIKDPLEIGMFFMVEKQ
ncbi:BON domain-containing protein [Marinicella sp. W31]|uniref:BON domain-containing protein n=1 Tax=Marinicella sp. W31 TaxID=3023713 RepID=UPI0037563181